jgi:acetoin utilization protein AcuB
MDAGAVMTTDVTWVDEDTPIDRAYRLMTSMKVRHLPVSEHGRVVGIVSDRDLLLRAQRGIDGEPRFPELCAAEVMTFGVVSRPPDANVEELAALMVSQRIDSIPIVDRGGALLGLVTSTDLLRLVAEDGLSVVD